MGAIAFVVAACDSTSQAPRGPDASDVGHATDGASDTGLPDAPASAACTGYCEGIARTCNSNPQYDSNATCFAYCQFMPGGSAATANTLACRAEALARFDRARPTTSCLAAGPGGDLGALHACGSPCATFCGMALRICPAVFADTTACMNECASFPSRPVYSIPNMDANTYGCRLFYLTQAALRADLHCGKIGASSPVCR
jgi:hypothetical protein